MPDLFGNVTSQLPPWLTNTPSPSAIVDKAFQAKDQSIRNYTELAQVNQRQQELAMAKQRNDQLTAMAPLLQQHQEQQNQLMAQKITLGAAAVDDEIQNNDMTSRVAQVRLLAPSLPNGFADPKVDEALDNAAIKYPGVTKTDLWKQTKADITQARSIQNQQAIQKLRNDRLPPGMVAAQYHATLLNQADELRAAGDEAGAIAAENEADSVLAMNARHAVGTAASQTSAQKNTQFVMGFRDALDATKLTGDPATIAKAQSDYDIASAGIPGLRKPGFDTLKRGQLRLWETQLAQFKAANPTMSQKDFDVQSSIMWNKFQERNKIDAQSPPSNAPLSNAAVTPVAPAFKSQDEVNAAYKSGKISYKQAADILKNQFGAQ